MFLELFLQGVMDFRNLTKMMQNDENMKNTQASKICSHAMFTSVYECTHCAVHSTLTIYLQIKRSALLCCLVLTEACDLYLFFLRPSEHEVLTRAKLLSIFRSELI